MQAPRTAPVPVSPSEVLAPLAPDLERVEDLLARTVRSEHPLVREMVDHCRSFSGKRLRPALVLLAGRAAGRWNPELVPVAVVVEMIHTATLVHDDVLDEAALRRRVPSCNALFGNEGAVLLGDYLFATAFALSASLENRLASRYLAHITAQVCQGEILQNRERGNLDLPEERYFEIIEKKTAILYAASAEVGARYAGASEAHVADLHAFGLAIGLAFQIVDDCLDLDGDEEEVGKSLGTDVAKGKMTLPVIHFLRTAPPAERDALRRLLVPHAEPARGGEPLRGRDLDARGDGPAVAPARAEARDRLRRHGSLAFAMARAESLVQDGRRRLDALPPSPWRDALHGLAEYCLLRTR
jgi:octaprenyl-diphosphate synthase